MILPILFLFATAQADEATFNAQIANKSPYTLKFTPPPAHHFNLHAPAAVTLASGETSSLKKDEHEVTAVFKTAKLDPSCTVKANLYVCNDDNTYCRPLKREFSCADLKSK